MKIQAWNRSMPPIWNRPFENHHHYIFFAEILLSPSIVFRLLNAWIDMQAIFRRVELSRVECFLSASQCATTIYWTLLSLSLLLSYLNQYWLTCSGSTLEFNVSILSKIYRRINSFKMVFFSFLQRIVSSTVTNAWNSFKFCWILFSVFCSFHWIWILLTKR